MSHVAIFHQVVATHPYEGEDEDELTFEKGVVISVIPYDDPEDEVRVEYKTVIVRLSCSCDLTSFPGHHPASRCLQYGFHLSDVTGRKTIEKL